MFSLTGAYFDFDGSYFLNDTFPPGINGVLPILGALSGLSASHISYPTAAEVLGFCDSSYGVSPCGGHPTTLTFTFTPGSFIAGDSFRFSADVDGGPVVPGASFALAMSGEEAFSAPFVTISRDRAEALISLEASPAPEPGTGAHPSPSPTRRHGPWLDGMVCVSQKAELYGCRCLDRYSEHVALEFASGVEKHVNNRTIRRPVRKERWVDSRCQLGRWARGWVAKTRAG